MRKGFKIKKGDKVIVVSGRDRGEPGRGAARPARGGAFDRAGRQRGSSAISGRGAGHPGGIIHQGGVDPRLQRRARGSGEQQADPGRLQIPRRRAQGAVRPSAPAKRSWIARGTGRCRGCTTNTARRSAASCKSSSAMPTPCRSPGWTRSSLNMGVGEATQDQKKLQSGDQRDDPDHRPEAGGLPGAEVGRQLQAARGNGDRLQGDAAGARMYEFSTG